MPNALEWQTAGICALCDGFGGIMETEHNAKDVMESDHEAGKQGDQADEDRR